MNTDRYHLTLTADGQPVIHGWWASEATARRKFREWIGERGDMAGARVTLIDEETRETLTQWPDTVGGGR